MAGWLQRVVEVGHLTVLITPASVLGLDGDDTALHIVYVVLILFQGHGDDGDIDLFVDAFRLQTVLQEVTRGMGQVVSHLNGLCDGLDRLGVDHSLCCVEMAHDKAEEPEEKEEYGQTEKHDAHGPSRQEEQDREVSRAAGAALRGIFWLVCSCREIAHRCVSYSYA